MSFLSISTSSTVAPRDFNVSTTFSKIFFTSSFLTSLDTVVNTPIFKLEILVVKLSK